MALPIYILNGPNLNLLGQREPEIYGHTTLDEIEDMCAQRAVGAGLPLVFRQTNSEGELVDWIQEARTHASALILNAAAYTHTSVATLDALNNLDIPVIEVHISNIFKREDFRHHSFVSPASTGVICGLGAQGYIRAMDALIDILGAQSAS